MALQSKRFLCFLMAAIGGALVWLVSPTLFGAHTPWDGNVLYYAAMLLLLGLVLRLVFMGTPILIYGGVFAGQLFGMVWPEWHILSVWPLGLILLLLFTLFAHAGAWFGAHLR